MTETTTRGVPRGQTIVSCPSSTPCDWQKMVPVHIVERERSAHARRCPNRVKTGGA